jgi:hypothetical protein
MIVKAAQKASERIRGDLGPKSEAGKTPLDYEKVLSEILKKK